LISNYYKIKVFGKIRPFSAMTRPKFAPF